MVPTTQNTSIQEVQELDTTTVTNPPEPTTPRTSSFSSLSSSSFSSSSPSSSSPAATTTAAQQQPPQPLDVTPSVISNFVVTGTDASFVGYTDVATQTPTGTLPSTGAEAEASSAAQAQGTAAIQNMSTASASSTSTSLTTAARTLEDLEVEIGDLSDLSEAERTARAWEKLQRQKLGFMRVIPHLVEKVEEPVDEE